MMRMLVCALLAFPLVALAEGLAVDEAPDVSNRPASLQNGAKLFVNYCLNCHSAALMRYNRLRDIGLTDEQIKDNLLFTTDKVGNLMTVAMRPEDAKLFFGATPPDLSVMARAKSADYIYTYLRSYYLDPTRPTGWNNTVYPNTAMPNPLWQLQGTRDAVFADKESAENPGEKIHQFVRFQQVTPGQLSAVDYDAAVGDLAGFMNYMAEPSRDTRRRVGTWVLVFLVLLGFVAWRLNASYWKDIK